VFDAAVPSGTVARAAIAITINAEALRRSKLANYEPELVRWLAREQLDQYRDSLRSILASELRMHLADVSGTVRIAERADVRVTLTLGSLVEATNLATLVQSQRQSPQIKQLFDRFDVLARGSTVTFQLGMTDAQLAAVLPQLRALLGPS
jgi:hypothetical protein